MKKKTSGKAAMGSKTSVPSKAADQGAYNLAARKGPAGSTGVGPATFTKTKRVKKGKKKD